MSQKILRIEKNRDGNHTVLDPAGVELGYIPHRDLMRHVADSNECLEKMHALSSLPSSAGTSSTQRKIQTRVIALMEDEGLDVGAATARVLREDRSLAEAYHNEHRHILTHV